MIVSCPSCNLRFLVANDALGEAGRTVRCGSCGHKWFQAPEKEAAPEAPAPVKKPPRAPRDIRRVARIFALSSAAVFLLSISLLTALPKTLTKKWEPTARLYETIGLPVPVLGAGLTLDAVEVHSNRVGDGYAVLVHGQVTNLSESPVAVPNMLVTVRDAGKRPLLQWLANAEQKNLQPREKLLFTSQQVINNQLATSVLVRFTELSPEQP